MRTRGVCAAVAGVVGAATAHALDEAGLLPGVHESAAVREALSPSLTVCWFALAGTLAWLAARTRRPVLVGASAALVVAAVPELAGRLDPGAAFEPAALAGAALQWVLLVVVLAVLVLFDRHLTETAMRRARLLPVRLSSTPVRRRRRTHVVPATGRPRAPPRHVRPCCCS